MKRLAGVLIVSLGLCQSALADSTAEKVSNHAKESASKYCEKARESINKSFNESGIKPPETINSSTCIDNTYRLLYPVYEEEYQAAKKSCTLYANNQLSKDKVAACIDEVMKISIY